MRNGDCLKIRAVVHSMPLVERRYRVALWIDSGAFVGEIEEVFELIVAPAAVREGYVPPRPEVRGWVDFKTESSSKLQREASLAIEAGG